MADINEQFSRIYEQYVARIYRFVYLKVSSREVAEDLSSEVFLRVLKHMQSPNSPIENAQAFLYRVARNVLADHYRGQKVAMVSIEKTTIEFEDAADPTRNQAEISLEMERIRQALAQINEDYQDLIIWRYIDELSFPEIAQITGKTEENVRVGLHRALQALKARMGQDGLGPGPTS